MPTTMPLLPALAASTPKASPFLPWGGIDSALAPVATAREVVELADGDTLRLVAETVRRTIGRRTFLMYGFNGQYPGPLIEVGQGATITVLFSNRIDLPTSVHWHGVRIENRYDGVPGVTQEAVPPGGEFVYHVRFPDAGIYWYHPHHLEEIQQDLGLYGNMVVQPADTAYWNPVDRQEFLMLDDLLVDDGGLFPYGIEAPSHALMGRFGNVMLVNGEPAYRLQAERGDIVRFFLTDVANSRTFNLDFGGQPTKLVAADLGKFERESWISSVVIAPAQRYVVEVLLDTVGTVALTNRIQAIDHFRGIFEPRVDTLGLITVRERTDPAPAHQRFGTLGSNPEVSRDIDRYRELFDLPPDKELLLTMRAGDLPQTVKQIMSLDTLYYPPVEWNDVMPMMNYLSSGRDVEWIMRDVATGRENMDIDWRFRVGQVVKIRLTNATRGFHPMQHPIHLHGQRFLVLDQDGVRRTNLVWQDTVLLPVGSTVDILMEVTNPGRWMAHCHIAEHLAAGMKMVFTVTE